MWIELGVNEEKIVWIYSRGNDEVHFRLFGTFIPTTSFDWAAFHILEQMMIWFLTKEKAETYNHLLTTTVDITCNDRFLATFVYWCMNPFIIFEVNRWLKNKQMKGELKRSRCWFTVTSRPSGVVSSNCWPGVNSRLVVFSALSDRMAHLAPFSLITNRGFNPLAIIRVANPTPISFIYSSKFSPSTYDCQKNEQYSLTNSRIHT